MALSKMTAGYKNTHGLILKKSSDGPMLRTLPTSAQWGPSSDQPAALSVGCRVWLYQRTSKCTRQSSKQRQFALFPRTVAGFHPSQATPHATCVFPPRFHLRPLRMILFLKLPGLRGPLPVATTHHYHVRPTIRVTIQVLPVSGADRAVVGQRAPGAGHAWVPPGVGGCAPLPLLLQTLWALAPALPDWRSRAGGSQPRQWGSLARPALGGGCSVFD